MRRLAFFGLVTALALAVAAYLVQRNRVPTPPYAPEDVAITPSSVTPAGFSLAAATPAIRHLEYVLPDGGAYVYDIDRGHRLVERISLPQAKGIRGVVASPRTHMLYVSYGGDGGENGTGSMLEYDLVSDRVVWQKDYPTGIDSMAISRDGRRIFMPTGELASGGAWSVIDARYGRVLSTIQGGKGPHNTVVSIDGKHVYLGGRNGVYLTQASTATGRVTRRVGPLRSGVRPFTIDAAERFAFTTATGFLGFQVSSIPAGRVLFTVAPAGFSWSPDTFEPSAPSHGISLSPDGREIWLMDAPNSTVHVYDVRGLPGRRPRRVADIRLTRMAGHESPCSYDCARDGWIQHSRDGRYVYVGDAGDVIDTRTRRIVARLAPLRSSRKHLEIDWRGGVPVATTSRTGLGYGRG